jgi:hypothetical protein
MDSACATATGSTRASSMDAVDVGAVDVGAGVAQVLSEQARRKSTKRGFDEDSWTAVDRQELDHAVGACMLGKPLGGCGVLMCL